MNKKINRKEILEFIFIFLISLTIISFFSMEYLNEDNCNYAVEEIHCFNDNIFKGNMSTLEMEFSPRYYANMFMAFLIRVFNSDWYEISFWLIKVNYILYALVVVTIVFKFFKKNRLLVALIVSFCLVRPSLISIAFGLDFSPDVFLGTAAPLAFLSLICVLGRKKYWMLAWILAILATFLHIHEGFWVAFLLGVIWLAICFADKKINLRVLSYICIYLFILLLIVFPTFNNQIYVDEDYFTQIYVYIRTPHHLLLSYIGKWQIIKSTFLLFILLIIFFNIFKQKKYKSIRRIIFSTYFLSISYVLLYSIHYFSTEKFKIPLIITMYIPKSFRFFILLGIISYIILGMRKIKKGMYIRGTILLVIPLVPDLSTNEYNYYMVLILLTLFFILEKFKPNGFIIIRNRHCEYIAKLILYLFIFFIIFKKYPDLDNNLKWMYYAILLYEFIYSYIKNIKLKSILLLVILFLFTSNLYNSIKIKIFNIIGNKKEYNLGLEYSKKATDLELYEIAEKFKNITSLNEEFVADPYAIYPNYFQLFSERNCYVLYKNTPSQKHLVIQWYERVQKVKNINELNEEELKKLLEDINVKYILLTEDRFNVVEESNYFEEVIKNEKYGIFKLKEDIE